MAKCVVVLCTVDGEVNVVQMADFFIKSRDLFSLIVEDALPLKSGRLTSGMLAETRNLEPKLLTQTAACMT